MNYAGHEQLRAGVAALANSMCDLRTTLNVLDSRYRYDAESLAERLAAQSLRRINELFNEAYREALVLEENFKD